MSTLQANINFLNKKFPHVVQSITNMKADESSVYTERVEKDEAWLEAVEGSVGSFKLIFMYGFGQGLALIDLLEKYPDRWIFVYEPNVATFYDTIEKFNFVELFQHPGFKGLAVGEEHLKMLFSSILNYMESDLAFVAHRHYLEQDSNQLYELKEEFLKYNQTFEVNQQTMNHFRVQWMQNSMYQLANVLTSPSIENLAGSLPGSTAVVVGSGPSLQQDIEWLQRMKPHALIIAAGSSIQVLAKHGIEPHLTVVMDGGEINTTIFNNPETLVAPLLITSTAYHGINPQHEGQTIYSVLRNDFVSQYCIDKPKEAFLIEPTSTVTGTAMQAAIALGAKRIIMMGQDLSFPNNQFYAEGVNHAYLPYLQMKVDEAVSNQLRVENVHGSLNTTTASFMFMKEGLEELIASCPNVQFINSTRNGAKIAGSIFMPTEDVWPLLENESMEEAAIRNLINNQKVSVQSQNIVEIRERITDTVKDFGVVKQELQALKKLLAKAQDLSRSKPLKAQQVTEQIELAWTKIVNRSWFEPVADCMIPIELSQFDKQLPVIVTEKNIVTKTRLIYVHLGELADRILNMLTEIEDIFYVSIERLEKISIA
ncbi:6-hydroxymethylpterin diphosphokinase MptE-like protein [Paenibacillus hunanensis]|uniref:motility associated factor glycosyltransferase family protein n=1 Tax=Paenibacillus hunanensis TaxID=539262 RepID=UPI002A6B43E0|nr:6-hydroxymethylpterin diphosphokinase MptE-like protein [Paenibacillus hunanensis]WPP42025.1 6-hydroxymethylpterin diphosphokinase MptE-like protein [Paenibacillus hunanensis]